VIQSVIHFINVNHRLPPFDSVNQFDSPTVNHPSDPMFTGLNGY
jgi:hypothetical protein